MIEVIHKVEDVRNVTKRFIISCSVDIITIYIYIIFIYLFRQWGDDNDIYIGNNFNVIVRWFSIPFQNKEISSSFTVICSMYPFISIPILYLYVVYNILYQKYYHFCKTKWDK